MHYLPLFLVSLPVIVVLDFLWFSFSLEGIYKKGLGNLLADSISLIPAAIFYFVYALALVVLVVEPALEKHQWLYALMGGALLGLASYGAYNLTNLSVMRDWPVAMSLIDLAWGTCMTAAASTATYIIATSLLGR